MRHRTVALIFTIITIFLTPIFVIAQNNNVATIIGRIIDANNTPIPNAMLVVIGDNGETNGTITHDDGTFKLTTTLGSKKITISRLGYAKRFIEKEITGSIDLGNLYLNFNDIFNTAGHNSFTIYGSNRDIQIDKFVNTRCIELKVGYKFNTTKSKYRGTGAGNTEKNRL